MKLSQRMIAIAACMGLCAILLAGCRSASTSNTEAVSSQSGETSSVESEKSVKATAAVPVDVALESSANEDESAVEYSDVEEDAPFQIAETVELPIVDKTMTFSMWCSAPPGGLSVVGSPIIEYIEAETNIHLDLLEQNMMTSGEKFNLMVASQDYSDIISAFDESYTGGAVKGYEDDVIIDLTDLIEVVN